METLNQQEPQEVQVESPYKLKWSEMALWIDEVATGKRSMAGEAGNPGYSPKDQVHFLRTIDGDQDEVLILPESRPSYKEEEHTVPANSPIKVSGNEGAKTLRLSDFLPNGYVYDYRILYLASMLAEPQVDASSIETTLAAMTRPVIKSDGKLDEEQDRANQALIDHIKLKLEERKTWWPTESPKKVATEPAQEKKPSRVVNPAPKIRERGEADETILPEVKPPYRMIENYDELCRIANSLDRRNMRVVICDWTIGRGKNPNNGKEYWALIEAPGQFAEGWIYRVRKNGVVEIDVRHPTEKEPRNSYQHLWLRTLGITKDNFHEWKFGV